MVVYGSMIQQNISVYLKNKKYFKLHKFNRFWVKKKNKLNNNTPLSKPHFRLMV